MKTYIRFTLVELMVVITIIMILMALLLPAIKKSKAKANEINCLGNQKQVGLAICMYTNDYNSIFYCSQAVSSSENAYPSLWHIRLKVDGYLANYKSVFCPALPEFSNNTWFSYGAFNVVDNMNLDSLKYPGIALSNRAYSKVGYTRLALAGCSWSLKSQSPYPFMRFAGISETDNYSRPHLIHSNKCNLLFADGHASSNGISKLSSVYYPTINNGICSKIGVAIFSKGSNFLTF